MQTYEKGKIPHIVFGSGSAMRTSIYLDSYDVKKCLIVSGPRVIKHPITQNILKKLEEAEISYKIFTNVLSEPSDKVCFEIADIIKNGNYDCVLGIGGGSPMDAAKAASTIAGIPEEIEDLHEYGKSGSRMNENWKRKCMLVLMPTTAGTGAETTASAVISSEKHHLKFSFGNRNSSADLCIIDPEFTIGMPALPTVYGGVDALAHIIEILVGTGANDYTNIILLEVLNKVWTWLPIAVKDPNNLEAREQLSWAAHNALANGGIPNGHAVAHAIGSIYHLVHGHACMVVLPTVIRHFANDSREAIQKIGEIIGVSVVDDAKANADNVADAILEYYKSLGLKPFREAMLQNEYDDDLQTFTEKMIPAILDDFKSRQWLPPIHTGNYTEKIGKICESIYNEK